MIVIDYNVYSVEFIQQALEMAQKLGLQDTGPQAGRRSHTKNGLSVMTPLGEMNAYCSYETESFPGIAVDIVPKDNVIGLASCEVDAANNNVLRTFVFADADDDNYSHEIFHYGEELGGEKCSNP